VSALGGQPVSRQGKQACCTTNRLVDAGKAVTSTVSFTSVCGQEQPLAEGGIFTEVLASYRKVSAGETQAVCGRQYRMNPP
jgi:hypothetical protein